MPFGLGDQFAIPLDDDGVGAFGFPARLGKWQRPSRFPNARDEKVMRGQKPSFGG